MSDLNSEKIQTVSQSGKRKTLGCIFYFIIFLCIWIAGAWGLWHISKDQPVEKEKSEGSSLFFEIIPGSDERTSVDDNMDDRGRRRPGNSED